MSSTSEKIVLKGGKNDGYVYLRSQLLSNTHVREVANFAEGLCLEIYEPTGRHDPEGDEIWEYKGRQLVASAILPKTSQPA